MKVFNVSLIVSSLFAFLVISPVYALPGGRADQIGHHVVEQLRNGSLRRAEQLSPHLRDVLNTFRTNGKKASGGSAADETDLLQGFYYLAGKDPTNVEPFSAELPNLEHASEVEGEMHARLQALAQRLQGVDPKSELFERIAKRESEKLFASWDAQVWTFAEDMKPAGHSEKLQAGGNYHWPIYELPPAVKDLTLETYNLFHSNEFVVFENSLRAIRAVFNTKNQVTGDNARSALVSYTSHLNHLINAVFPRALDALKKEKKKWIWNRRSGKIRNASREISERLYRVSMLLVGDGVIDRLIEESGASEAEAQRISGEYRAATIRLRDHQHELMLDGADLD